MTGTIRLNGDELALPGQVTVQFMRTLRIPETGVHPLPPGLGLFPIRRVQDYPDTVPAEWSARGGVMIPLYQREAVWLLFNADQPAALSIGVGKVCAVCGEEWTDRLRKDPQNYVPLPEQPWLDGINAGDGFIRQFVAVPLGLGATVEGQVTGEETFGGIQLAVRSLTPKALAAWEAAQAEPRAGYSDDMMMCGASAMGLGAGGRMRQEVYADDRPLDQYAGEPAGRVFVHLVSAARWRQITGETPPPTPVNAAAYTAAGLPWFDYYDADHEDLTASDILAKVKPTGDWLGDIDVDPWLAPMPDQTVQLKDKGGDPVTDGDW